MTNGQRYGVTLDELMEMDVCDDYSRDDFEYSRKLFGDRERMTIDDILSLDISVKDKIWIIDEIVPRREMARFQVVWAYRVLPLFEREYPNDDRPRMAIEALEAWIEDPSTENKNALAAAMAAASAAANASSITAARASAMDAAAITAAMAAAITAARDAARAAARAAARDAARAAARDAAWAAARDAAWAAARDAAWEGMLRDLVEFAAKESP